MKVVLLKWNTQRLGFSSASLEYYSHRFYPAIPSDFHRSQSRRSLNILGCCPSSNPHFNSVVSPTFPRAPSPLTVAPHPAVSVTSLPSEPQLQQHHQDPLLNRHHQQEQPQQQDASATHVYCSPAAASHPLHAAAPPVVAHMNAGTSFRPIKSSSFSASCDQRFVLGMTVQYGTYMARDEICL